MVQKAKIAKKSEKLSPEHEERLAPKLLLIEQHLDEMENDPAGLTDYVNKILLLPNIDVVLKLIDRVNSPVKYEVIRRIREQLDANKNGEPAK